LHQAISLELADRELQHIEPLACLLPNYKVKSSSLLTVPLHYAITNTFHSLSLGFLGYDCVYFSFET
jgi:hypothetical protein